MKIQLVTLASLLLSVSLCAAQPNEPAAVSQKAESHQGESVAVGKPRIEVVFVLDTTGSMAGLIEAAKQKIWAIANTLVTAEPAPEIRFGLVGYRDRKDAYVTKMTALTDDIDAVYTELMSFAAVGGGDAPESVNQALFEAVHQIEWSADAGVYRVIYLVGDAPPHMDYDDDVAYKETCSVAAKRDIFVNTIQCGNMAETGPVWREIAQLAKGSFAQIEQSGGAVVQESPFDKDIAEHSKRLDATRVYYGNAEAASLQKMKLDKGIEIYSKASIVSLAQRAAFNGCPSGNSNFCGFQELVNDFSTGKIKLSEMKKDVLPKELQALSTAELKKHLVKKNEERTKLQQHIAELSKQRQQWLAAELTKRGEDQPVLDRIIYDSIRTQAQTRGIEYDNAAPKL